MVGSTIRRGVVTVCVAAAAVTGAAACSDDESADPSATTQPSEQIVSVKLFQFQPQSVPVDAGTSIVWENGDDTIHEPTSGTPGAIDPLFDVTIDGVGAKGSFTFTEPGTYQYFCQLHTSMTGEVVVS